MARFECFGLQSPYGVTLILAWERIKVHTIRVQNVVLKLLKVIEGHEPRC